MQDHPLAVEAKFSKIFRDTISQLSNTYPSLTTSAESSPSPLSSTSALAGLANLASSALGNSFVQTHLNILLDAAQSSTLPVSTYFDHEHFLSLTLFDLAMNAPTTAISKTLLDMAQHRLPLSRSLFTSNTSTSMPNTGKSSSTSSSSRMKSLGEMINNYTQLTNVSNGSLQELLLDVTIPLEASKASKTIQYYKRLDEHCRQYYHNEQNSCSIEQQAKLTGDLFENDPHAKLDLIAYIR
jgi:hypothetical protein